MRRNGVDIGGQDVGLDFVGGGLGRGGRVADRIHEVKEAPRLFMLAQLRKGHGRPDGCMRVLPPVLAHAGNVPFDIARVEMGLVKGRIEHLNDPGLRPHQTLLHSPQGLAGTLRVPGAAENGPGLGHRVNLALWTGLGTQRFAVVEPGAQVPLAVPGMSLDVLAQLGGLGQAALGKERVAAGARQPGKLGQHIVEEEGQPDTLAAPEVADQVHAVIPVAPAHERQAVRAKTEAVLDGAHAMLVEGPRFAGAPRQVIVGVLLGLDRPGVQIGNRFVQHSGVRQALDVVARHVGQPQVVVGEMGPHPAARGGVPPMLHIALAELARGGAEKMLAGQGGGGVRQSHDVLQLVAKSIGPAGLVEPAPAPEPATQGLIEQPAVGQHIDGRVRGFHAHGAQGVSPMLPHLFEGATAGPGSAKAPDERLGLRGAPARSEAEDDLAFLPGRQVAFDLHGGAGIQARAGPAGEPRPFESRRMGQGSVAAEELPPVARERARRLGDIHK
eukprot:TRINITY_DN18937_c0_g2_i1.p2 TRINITY_DN18937_c0_g2~~TRINITY_DN18937_c0_g2_i1.p2  ORF type:complete len:499 (+),score=45.42 TRINITY_DN18937_c0_g2_i1:295-1791(+)